MRKHTITAFTFAPGDVLYYIQNGQIKSVTLTEEHLDKSEPKEIMDDYILEPNEKVEQRRNGKLVLWKAYTRSGGRIKSSIHYYVGEFVYHKVNSPFVVDKELLELELKKKKK
ncbi:MAG: hypothetical protein D8H99_28545 [Streptococcus sp.]|nr:MAG: hypothetical protein D8H99_28545 [Streptococcus sp.]